MPVSPEMIEPLVRIARDGDALSVRALTKLDGEVVALPAKAFLGRPAHGAWIARDDEVLFGPLSRTLSPAAAGLFRHGELRIPDGEVETFAAGYLPQLRRAVAVEVGDGVVLPEPEPPRLLCRVDFSERAAGVRWGFRYRTGATIRDVGLAPEPGVARDRVAESRLAEAVPRGPWVEAGLTGAELRPAFLTGRPLISFVTEVLPVLEERDDVLVRLSDNRRFRLDQQVETQIQLNSAHQEVSGQELPHDHVLYRYPLNPNAIEPLY